MNTAAIILSLNEEIHIKRCILSLKNYVDQIIVLDSGSTDDTIKIAKELGVSIYFREWDGPSNQLNWAIKNILSNYDWVIRLDADEYIINNNKNDKLKDYLYKLENDVCGIEILRSIKFLGKILKFGGVSNLPILRIFKPYYAITDGRLMDEHIVISHGKIIQSNIVIIDDNNNNIDFWLKKHLRYANAEFTEYKNLLSNAENLYYFNINKKLNLNHHILNRKKRRNFYYMKMPLLFRSLLYFIYRYFFKLGFLDGRNGFIFHFLQAFWYRLVIDIKIIQDKDKNNGQY